MFLLVKRRTKTEIYCPESGVHDTDKDANLYEMPLDLQGLESRLYIIENIDGQGNREQKRVIKL